MEVKVWLIDRISEEELWLVEIKFGGILNMVTAKVSKLPSEFATKYNGKIEIISLVVKFRS
jgi:hypothetical protein